jgi:streptomycin 6-kinase
MADLAVPLPRRDELLVDAAMQLWRPAPDVGLPTGADQGRWLIDHIRRLWDELDHPCSARAVDHAVECAERRIAAHDDERAVLVHGDVHQWNALQAGDGFKLIDPDGLLAAPEYDLGVLLREDPDAVLVGDDPARRAHRLAARSGLDATAIWEWAVVERLSTGLLGEQIGLQPVGRQMLEVAELVAGSSP